MCNTEERLISNPDVHSSSKMDKFVHLVVARYQLPRALPGMKPSPAQ